MMKNKSLAIIGFILLWVVVAYSQTTNDYRSVASGRWNQLSIWQRYNGTAWVAATVVPSGSTANNITLQSGNIVTLSASISADQLLIESHAELLTNPGVILTLANGSGTDLTCFGTLVNKGTISNTSGALVNFGDGSVYEHASTLQTSAIPTATWSINSTCIITDCSSSTTDPTLRGVHQEFYNIIFDIQTSRTRITVDYPPTQINGDFIIYHTGVILGTGGSTSSGVLVGNYTVGQAGEYNLEVKGDFKMYHGIFDFSSGNKSVQFTLHGDFFFDEGAVILSGHQNQPSVDFIFAANETHVYTKNGGKFDGIIDFTVPAGATLDLGTSVLGEGSSGGFTLAAGATLITANPDGISTRGESGSIQVSGTRIYDTNANYVYNGDTPQITGTGLPSTVGSVTIDNPAGVTLTDPATIIHELDIIAGELENVDINNNLVDGYNSPVVDRIIIQTNNVFMRGFDVSTSDYLGVGQYIDRKWTLQGSFTGTKSVTFLWDYTDDASFGWTAALPPVLFIDGVEVAGGVWDGADPRKLVYNFTAFPISSPSPIFTIGLSSGETLPVELSSFTVTENFENGVKIQWITQSETNAAGFGIFRGKSPELHNALRLNAYIAASNTSHTQVYVYYDLEATQTGTYYYWLISLEMDGNSHMHGPVKIDVTETNPGTPPVPLITGISGIYPNPMESDAKITYVTAVNTFTELAVFNMRGQKVRSLVLGDKNTGTHNVTWDGKDVYGQLMSGGVYIIRMRAENKTWTKKVTLIK